MQTSGIDYGKWCFVENFCCFESSAFCVHSMRMLPVSLVLSEQLGFFPPNHICDSILGSSESFLPARRSQGASKLSLFIATALSPLSDLDCLAQHRLVNTFQNNPTREWKILFPSASWSWLTTLPVACLTSVISRKLVCQRGYDLAPPVLKGAPA